MARWATLRTCLVVAAVIVPWVIVWPSLEGFIHRVRGPDAPIARGMRVPSGVSFLIGANPDFERHDRILDLSLEGDEHALFPRSREELLSTLERSAGKTAVLRVARGREVAAVAVAPRREAGWQALSRNWPLLFLAASFLLFGLTIALGSRHPVAPPLFAVAWCTGATLLSQIDLLFPEDPGIHGIASLRARLGVIGLSLLPASVIHLAMRFPVVAPQLRSPAMVALVYVFWLFPAIFAQIHLDHASFLNALENIAIGTTFVAAGLLAVGSLTSIRRMTPIERARARALLLGLGVGSVVPLVYFLWEGESPPELETPLLLSVLAFPAAISWAVVRYRLLDPPAWARSAFLTGLSAIVALLCASGLVSLGLTLIGEPAGAIPAEVVPVALTTTVVYQVLHSGFWRGASSRALREGAFERFLEHATRDLARARTPGEVLAGVALLIREHLGASDVRCLPLPVEGDRERLSGRGLELWQRHGDPLHQVVRARDRAEDPGPEMAEIVLSLLPESGPGALVVVASRADGLPYGEEDERMLASLRHVATTALEAAATTVDLEAKVAEKTRSLEAALLDRKAVLRAARTICEAEHAAEVVETVQAFAAGRGDSLLPVEGARIEALRRPGFGSDIGPSERSYPGRDEPNPQLETLMAFATLAIARLELLSELKREVERQAQEIGEIKSRRLYAEFVRCVAHELRKPTEEVRNRIDQLALLPLAPGAQQTLVRIRAAGREMSRRLDLLLFHSGLRLDLQRIDLVRLVDTSVEALRSSGAARTLEVEHDLARLPLVGDPSRLLSVLENLLDNAVKATREGKAIAVRTSLERDRGHRGNWVQFEVRDEGHGIAPENLARIFEPGVGFGPIGFGLGLSLCREIVRMHGGAIDVTSQPGSTVFLIRLPQIRSEEADDDPGVDPVG